MLPEHRLHLLEVQQGVVFQLIDQPGCGGDQVLHRRILAVQDAQRVAVQTPLCLGIQRVSMPFEIGYQFYAMALPRVGITQRIQLQRNIGQSQLAPQPGAHHDLLDVDIGTGETQRFDAELMELAVAALLRALMAEHRPRIP